MILQLDYSPALDRDRLHDEVFPAVEFYPVKAAESCGDLVLRADGLADDVLLDVNGGRSKLAFADHSAGKGIQGVQKADCERRAGADPRARRQIAGVDHFDPLVDPHELQALANGGVLYLVDIALFLSQAVPNAILVLEKRRQEPTANVAVLVDGRIEHNSAIFAVPDGIIRPAAEKRDTKWRSADNHPIAPVSFSSTDLYCCLQILWCKFRAGVLRKAFISDPAVSVAQFVR